MPLHLRALQKRWGVRGPAGALAAGWWPTQLHLDNLFHLYPRCYTASVTSQLVTEAL